MSHELEIVIPARNPGSQLAHSIASLAAQTDRQFGVLLSDNFSSTGGNHLDASQRQLAAAGIPARRVKPPFELKRIEHWNWANAQSQAAWLKPLHPGELLQPDYVARLLERIAGRPGAKVIRCDSQLRTEWGTETLRSPFAAMFISAADFADAFPARLDWLERSVNFAFTRTAWLALGGYSPQLPGCAVLNANVLLTLHHGLENIAETLVTAELAHDAALNGNRRERVNHWLERWLILRQAQNYCLSAKLPWSKKCLLLRGLTATLGRW
jgi:hypothetical protein